MCIQAGVYRHSVEAQWYGDLDTYGSFCITIPLQQVLDIVTKLLESNADWSHRAALDPLASRNLDV